MPEQSVPTTYCNQKNVEIFWFNAEKMETVIMALIKREASKKR
jgi:hypothetical protein